MIRIVTDSVSDLPPSVAQANDITVVPLYVTIGGETYRDGVDIGADRFYSLLKQLPRLPTTSQPSVADFQDVYRRLLDQRHRIVSIHVSAKLSGTLNSASLARQSLDAASRIEIVDSRLAGGAQALLAFSAARWAGQMSDHRELARRAERSIETHHWLCRGRHPQVPGQGRPHRQGPGIPGRGAPNEAHPHHPRWRGPPGGASQYPQAGAGTNRKAGAPVGPHTPIARELQHWTRQRPGHSRRSSRPC